MIGYIQLDWLNVHAPTATTYSTPTASTMTSSNTTRKQTNINSSGLSLEAIVGATVGGATLLMNLFLIIAVLACLMLKRKDVTRWVSICI